MHEHSFAKTAGGRHNKTCFLPGKRVGSIPTFMKRRRDPMAVWILEDGSRFEGTLFGHKQAACGEVIFTTSSALRITEVMPENVPFPKEICFCAMNISGKCKSFHSKIPSQWIYVHLREICVPVPTLLHRSSRSMQIS